MIRDGDEFSSPKVEYLVTLKTLRRIRVGASVFGFVLLLVRSSESGPIIIDGLTNDWSGIPAAAVDPSGDVAPFSGHVTDLLSVHLTEQATSLFVLLTYSGSPFTGAITFDTDNNPSTGVTVHGAEYGLCFRSSDDFVILDSATSGLCNSASLDFFVPTFAFGGNSIEVAFPLSTFLGLTPSFTGTFTFNTGSPFAFDPLSESQVHSPVPEPASLVLLGSALAALVARRRDCRRRDRHL